jgi:predicted peptidase
MKTAFVRGGSAFLAWGLCAVATLPASAQEPGSVVAADRRVQGRSYVFAETGATVPYALFVPSTYDSTRSWPLIVGLHGLGRPYDWLMGYHGIIDMAERDGFVMVTPLGYHPRGWYGSRGDGIPAGAARDGEELPPNLGALSEQDVMNVLGIVRREFNIDADRIYLWGHSMGGAGTYHLASKYPDIWAGLAVAAPAPLSSTDRLEPGRHIPILVLHGDQDRTVPVERSREWVAKMKALGMEHLYVEIRGGDHSLFVSQNPETLSKIFSFFNIVRKSQRPAPTSTTADGFGALQ